VSFDASGDGLTFLSNPLSEETEITGPLATRSRVSSSTIDADIFLVFRVFTADMREVVFAGAIDPHTPVAQGWLRASHCKLDRRLSRPWRPYHAHDETAFDSGRTGRPGNRDLANVHCGSGRMPDRVVGTTTRLRMAKDDGTAPIELQERTDGMWAVPA
jgi:hypothetical protein